MLNLDYEALYNFSISNPEQFWDEIAKEVVWSQPYTHVLENKFSPSPKWFTGGKINMSYNCLDKHIEDGHGNDVAVIHDSPITGSTRSITYSQLLESVALLAGVMVDRCGIKQGDIVLLYFPVIPECLISMLACTRIGAIYVVVYGGFSAKELSVRIGHAEPKLIVTCNLSPEPDRTLYYRDKLDEAFTIGGFKPYHCLVYNRPNFRKASMRKDIDLDWSTELSNAKAHGPEPLDSSHPIFIIYTSGTTGEPKGLVHLTGPSVVCNRYFLKYLFGAEPKSTIWTISDFSWIAGQSIMSYGALLMGMKTILHEGKMADASDCAHFVRIMNWHKVQMILCPPTKLRMLRKFCSTSDLKLNYDGLKSINLGGELCDANLRDWAEGTFACQICMLYGQTEMGGVTNRSAFNNTKMVDNSVVLQTPGLDIRVVDRKTGLDIPRGSFGRIVLKLPTSPSMASTLFKNENVFFKRYFEQYPGFFDTMDAGFLREDGAIRIECRDDDIIHVSALRICGSAVEEACLKNEDLIEAVVIPLEDELQGHVPFAFLVPKTNLDKYEKDIIDATINLVNETIGEVACFKKAVIVHELPHIISGKIQRSSLVAMIHGHIFKIPATVVNGNVYVDIHSILKMAGYKASLPSDIDQ